jgi:hypothetical protein
MSCIRLIGRLIALFIIFLFVTLTPPLLLAYNAQDVAVRGDFLDELVADPDLFEAAIPDAARDFARNLREDFDTRAMPIARLEADDWELIIYAVAPPEFMQNWAQQGVEGWRRWVRRGGRFLDDIIIPFGEVRDNIVDDPEQTVLRTLTEAQPDCGSGREPLSGPNDLVPQCRPPASELEAFYDELASRWRERPRELWRELMPADVARYPDNISVADLIEEESEEDWDVNVEWRATRWGLRAARWLVAVCIAGQCVVALGVVALLAARNWREALRWVGTPLLLAGAFALLLTLLFFVGAEVGTWFIPKGEIPIGAREAIEDAGRSFADALWPPMAWQSGVLILIGLGLWVLSFFAPVRPEPTPAPAVAAPAAPTPTEPMGELAREPEEVAEISEPAQEIPESPPEEEPAEEPPTPPAEAEGEDEKPA